MDSASWDDLERALQRGEFSDAERALFRYTRSLLSEDDAFCGAIFRALDAGTEMARARLRESFPELHAAWMSWRTGALQRRLRGLLPSAVPGGDC